MYTGRVTQEQVMTHETELVPVETAPLQKNEVGLPLLALGFDLLPVLFWSIGSLVPPGQFASVVLLVSVMCPIIGLVIGVTALTRRKERIGNIGKIIAILAVALPIAAAVFLLLFFIGAMTGIISLM